jgi:hypothetical protein
LELWGSVYFLEGKIGVVGAIIMWLWRHNKTTWTNNLKKGLYLKN